MVSDAVLVALLGGLFGGGGLVTAVLAYVQQRRLSAGDVKSSPAEQLWQALNKAREQAEQRILAQEQRIQSLEQDIARMRDALAVKDTEVFTLRAQVKAYEQRIEELENELDELRGRVA